MGGATATMEGGGTGTKEGGATRGGGATKEGGGAAIRGGGAGDRRTEIGTGTGRGCPARASDHPVLQATAAATIQQVHSSTTDRYRNDKRRIREGHAPEQATNQGPLKDHAPEKTTNQGPI
jgi:hypothetical protein